MSEFFAAGDDEGHETIPVESKGVGEQRPSALAEQADAATAAKKVDDMSDSYSKKEIDQELKIQRLEADQKLSAVEQRLDKKLDSILVLLQTNQIRNEERENSLNKLVTEHLKAADDVSKLKSESFEKVMAERAVNFDSLIQEKFDAGIDKLSFKSDERSKLILGLLATIVVLLLGQVFLLPLLKPEKPASQPVTNNYFTAPAAQPTGASGAAAPTTSK